MLLDNSYKSSPSSGTSTSGVDHGEDVDDKKKRKKKMEKDPNAPKRNLSSYMLYSQAVRPDTVAKHPELKAVDIAKLIGDKWNALSDKEKQPFVKQAEKEKARFDKENLIYKSKLAQADSSSSSSPVAAPTPVPAPVAPVTHKRKVDEPKSEHSKKKSKSSKKKN